ncbi:MAG TPA: VOC family protein [Gemmatimonadaceae bacterium]|nr:VOC family protein [Gemmatimonadaceae bacterium]
MSDESSRFLGLRTVIYGVTDLRRAKEWYSSAFGIDPYFDEPYYIGFNIGGFELGLDPNAQSVGPGGCTAYWGVDDAAAAAGRMERMGATIQSPVSEVGGGIKVASVLDPFGNHIGIIENPHFDPKAVK